MRTDKIGINISRLRIERGITQEQLGRDIGLTASAISNIECGRSVPSVDTLCKFSELFGVKVDTILSDNRHSSSSWCFVHRSCVVCVLVADFDVEEIR